jgi:predicted phage terminase large subunit-like protein
MITKTPYRFKDAAAAVEIKRAEDAKNWTRTPATLGNHLSNGAYERWRFVDYLAERIVEVAEGPRFFIITVPPQHGKSELVSHYTPVWFLKRFPWKKVGLASYEMGYASEWGGKAKDTINDNAEELGLELRQDTKAKGRWNLRGYGGGMFVAGIGGPFTGRGFDLIIIDDPIKNPAEALSPVYRRRNWNWYRSVARTRLQPGGSIILIMTRWHEQDLAGALLGNAPGEVEGAEETQLEEEAFLEEDVESDPWEVINLPALAEENDPLGREPGEALVPERYDADALKKLRIAAGPYFWAAQFCGRPRHEGGGIIKTAWFKSYDEEDLPKSFSRVIQVWDTAHKERQQHDRSACLTIGQSSRPRQYFLLDLYVARLTFPELDRAAEAQYDKWNPDRVIIEDKSSGISLIQQLRADTHVPIRAVKAVDDKVTRAHTVTGIMEAGQVLVPSRAPWLADFLKEIGDFPNGAHDDIVDVLVHGLRFLKPRLKGRRPGVEHEEKKSRWRE